MADVDVALAPNSSVILEPAESLAFTLQPQTAPQAVLTIRNVSESRKIAFKVKTTRPLRYLVRPNQGMLGPHGSAAIMVILQQRDCDELLRLEPSERGLANDKFLVQSIFVDDAFYESVKTKSAKEMADELTNMWARTDKKSLANKKLRCRFVQHDELGGGGAAAAGGSGAAQSESPLASRFPSKSSIYSSSNSLLPAKGESNAPLPSADAEVATPAQLTAALLQETAAHKADSPVLKDPMADVAALRKKYDELVAFTVQLTAQRDKANSDAQRARKLNDEAASGATLRNRKPGGAAANGGGGSSDDAVGLKGHGAKDPAAFGLFHLLVCAIIFFLVGRYA
ncbi:hypothetical protein PybrP1_007745 [[Pythium] brassicae (nom. inval.)]|nr:hypothetical protein PybrP1_007745 [[Pythium] brassicae (nom. inval.)]